MTCKLLFFTTEEGREEDDAGYRSKFNESLEKQIRDNEKNSAGGNR